MMNERVKTVFLLPWVLSGSLFTPLIAQTQFTDHFLGEDPGGIYYRVGGNGAPLLLVHGFGLSGKEWDRFTEDLAAEFTLIIPDLPGHGKSTRLLDSWDYDEVAGLLMRVLDELGVESSNAIGHSAGATALLRIAVSNPKRIRSMVLVGQTHRLPLAARERARAWPEFDQLPPEVQDLYASYHQNGADQFKLLLPQFRGLADEYEAYDLSPEHVSRISAPTLIVAGDRDEFYPMELFTEFYEALPNGMLWVVPGQGHFSVWPELGGDELAAEEFPIRVKAFF